MLKSYQKADPPPNRVKEPVPVLVPALLHDMIAVTPAFNNYLLKAATDMITKTFFFPLHPRKCAGSTADSSLFQFTADALLFLG